MNIWQTSQWQNMLKSAKQSVDFFQIDNIFLEKRSIGLGQFGLFVLGISAEDIQKYSLQIQKLAKSEQVLFVQCETCSYTNDRQKEISSWKNEYYKKFISPYTALIDLKLSESEILEKMKPKGRYNIRLAEKKEIEVKILEKTSTNIKSFYDLMTQTTIRDSFTGNSLEYYTIFLQSLESAELIAAYKNNVLIAAGIFIFQKEVSVYYYGASSSKTEYRNLMAPYLLQWFAIGEAKKRNSLLFDFL